MAAERFVLTDVDRNLWLDQFHLTPADGPQLRGSADWSFFKRTLHGGTAEGVDVIELKNGPLTLAVCPTRGMGILHGEFAGLPLGWNSPVQRPVHPAFVNLASRNNLGWLDGFNEFLCRCGLAWNGAPGDDAGTPLTLHGRIANMPAHGVQVEIDPDGHGSLSVTGVVDETTVFGPCLRLVSTLRTEAGSNRFSIVDEVTNLSGQPAEAQLLYHTNIGRPFLEEGARFVAPIRELSPRNARAAEDLEKYDRYRGPEAGYAEQVYLMHLQPDANGETLALLRNAARDKGISVRFRPDELPCFSLWKCTQAEADGYVTGLEPATNFPHPRPFERQQGRVVPLGPGESWRCRLEFEIHATAEQVRSAEQEIARIQQGVTPVVHPHPALPFSPAP